MKLILNNGIGDHLLNFKIRLLFLMNKMIDLLHYKSIINLHSKYLSVLVFIFYLL